MSLKKITQVPRWHFAMLNDTSRNKAFFDVINSIDFTDKTVLDIGTGSGLLSMMIASKNPKKVYTCESNSDIAKVAKKIIKQNKLENKIEVINKLSLDLVSGEDLPENIDIMISETVDCGFFGEGFGRTVCHAKNNLLKYDALMIPESVSLTACLFSSKSVHELNFITENIHGFSTQSFNVFSTQGYFPVRLAIWPHSFISNTLEILTVNFKEFHSFDKCETLSFTANEDSICHGIVFWFDLRLKDDIYLTNSPFAKYSHWMQAVQLFETPFETKKDDIYEVFMTSNADGITFSL